MTTVYYASIVGIITTVVVFFTSILGTIYNMAVSGILQAQVFIGGLGLLYGVMLYNKAKKGYMFSEPSSRKWIIGILILTLLVAPYFISGAYANADRQYYLNTEICTANLGTGDWWADFYYYNTTGSLLGGGLTESVTENGTFTVGTLSATGQDLDAWAAIYIAFADTSIWNITGFDPENDEYITGIGLQVTTDSNSHTYYLDFGMTTTSYKTCFWDNKVFTGSDSSTPTRLDIGNTAWVSDKLTLLASGDVVLKIQEWDADEFVNGATPTFMLELYSNTYPDQFLEYLLLFGAFFGILGVIGTSSVTVMKRTPRRRGFNRNSRFRRYRRSYRSYRRRYRRSRRRWRGRYSRMRYYRRW